MIASAMKFMSPLAEQFNAEWSRHHLNRPPFGWLLRQDRSLPWVRFHALPESRRYSEDEKDRAIILSRANALGDRLLGPGVSCWIIEAVAGNGAGAGELTLEWTEENDPDSPVWRVYVRNETWQSGHYDQLLLSIADDQPNSVIWMARDSGSIFAPYDGGFDLFALASEEIKQLQSERPEWLSDHPAGL